MGMVQSVQTALDAVAGEPQDAAIRELALTYAAALDRADADVAELGPKLQAALDALLLTPRARAAALKGGERGPSNSPLDELRERRSRRDRAETLDPAAP